MKNKFLIKSLLLFLFVVTMSACDGTFSAESDSGFEKIVMLSDYPIYDSIFELSEIATDVIRGEVLDERVELINTTIPREDIIAEFGGENLSEEEKLELFPDYLGNGLWMDVDDQYEIVTIHQIRVLDVFQGIYQIDDIIEVMQPGGEFGNVALHNSELLSFAPSSDLVFFISSWSHIGRPAVLLNPTQSVYYFPEETQSVRVLRNFNSNNNLNLTLEDLERIYENANLAD